MHAVNQAWRFPRKSSDVSSSAGVDPLHSPGDGSSVFVNTPRKVSFFDVGGLLDSPTMASDSSSPTVTRQLSNGSRDLHREMSNSASGSGSGTGDSRAPTKGASGPRRGSAALLQDIGGLLSPSSTRDKARKGSVGTELQSLPERREKPSRRTSTPGELQDVGGLLG